MALSAEWFTEDPDLMAARGQIYGLLIEAGYLGPADRVVLAIEALIEMKIVIVMDALADQLGIPASPTNGEN